MSSELEMILSALRAHDRGEGLRVNEICAALSSNVPTPRVIALLDAAARTGTVRRDSISGRWRLKEPAPVSAPPKPSPTQRATMTSAPRSSAPPGAGIPVVPDAGIPAERDEGGVVDPSQRAVILAPREARQVVVAGPGFGKTAVACGRVAALLRAEVQPSRILLLSFTRTAVREMRSRIAALANDVEGAGAVDVRTLDSFAWRVRTGLSEAPREVKGFGASIDDTVKMLAQPDDDLSEYLQHFDHVIVDEAQDLVGARAELVTKLLAAVRPDAGYTVFLDPAQAIYDWSEDAVDGDASETFEHRVRALCPAPAWCELQHLHRTRDPQLRALLLGARRLVLDAPNDAYPRLRAALEARAPGDKCFASTVAGEFAGRDCGDLMVLTRRRGEALELSSQLTEQGVRHRLRFGALPQLAAPWIAPVLNQAYLGRESVDLESQEVGDAWEAVTAQNPWLCEGWDFETAWRLLRRLGRGRTKRQVDIRQVAKRLGGATLPDDALLREPGGRGPIVSTVHGSKGREATEAMLLLTQQHDEVLDEARVLYVGLSRAKERLDVRRYGGMHWGHLAGSGRPWRRSKSGKLQLEVGRVGDLDALRNAMVFGHAIADQQGQLATFDGACRTVRVWTFPEQGFTRGIVHENQPTPLATLSKACEDDLREAARALTRDAHARTPTYVLYLRWFDLGSVGLPPDAMPGSELPEPWQTTRLFLMPLIVGPGVAGGFQ
jgi:hypothetical protein